jgi:hypothetical protein
MTEILPDGLRPSHPTAASVSFRTLRTITDTAPGAKPTWLMRRLRGLPDCSLLELAGGKEAGNAHPEVPPQPGKHQASFGGRASWGNSHPRI